MGYASIRDPIIKLTNKKKKKEKENKKIQETIIRMEKKE